MNFSASGLLSIVGYVTVTLITGVGIAILTGILLPAYFSEQIRLILGISMVVYGIMRGIMIWLRIKHQRAREEAERAHEQRW